MHPGHRRVTGQPLRQRGRVRLGALHPHVQGAQAAQGEPGLERPRHSTVLAAVRDQPLGQRGLRHNRHAEQQVGVTGQVLRRAVHDHSGAGQQRALASTGVAKVLSTTPQGTRRAGRTHHGGQVDDPQQRVRRGLRPDHVGPVDGRAGCRVGQVDRPDLQPPGALVLARARRASRSRRPGRPRRRPAAPGRARPRPAAIPEANDVATPPSSAPTAASNISQVGLP